MLEERIESAQEAYRPRLEEVPRICICPPKIRTKSELIHDTSEVLEAKEVVRELPKTKIARPEDA